MTSVVDVAVGVVVEIAAAPICANLLALPGAGVGRKVDILALMESLASGAFSTWSRITWHLLSSDEMTRSQRDRSPLAVNSLSLSLRFGADGRP